jgi:DNA recombination protein RmuC
VSDLIKIGKKIDKTEYSGMNKLIEGKPLLPVLKICKKMGLKQKKSLPESIINRATKEDNELLN